MAYSCRVLLDSINPDGGRLTTFEAAYPRLIHSEMLTHRVFSRNSSSSRAIPIQKMIERVWRDPVVPVYWGKNQKGMIPGEELSLEDQDKAVSIWLEARSKMVDAVNKLVELGVHKQIANRLLEPWMWITVIISATGYGNFFNLRCHPHAQQEIQKIAFMMRDEYHKSKPKLLDWGEWHTPLIKPEEYPEFSLEERLKVSTGRSARVSYLTHDGLRDPNADVGLHNNLSNDGHWSPFEHIAQARKDCPQSGNFWGGWFQYRKSFEKENQSVYDFNN